MASALNYDEKCEELSRHFLGPDASDEKVQVLAAFIRRYAASAIRQQTEAGRLAIQDGEVEVRQLEWVQTGETSAYASSVLGQYMAFNFCWWLPGQKEAPETSFEAAKTAAQADYTARIRSALATTAGEAKPREELVVAISEELKHHEAFDGKPMAQLVWASRIYDNVLAAAPALVTDKG